MNEAGNKVASPMPHGLSGSPIIILHDSLKSGQEQEPLIVGVATTYKKEEKLIYGCVASIPLHFIGDVDEEIRLKRRQAHEST